MKCEQDLIGIDGSHGSMTGYVLDNDEDVDLHRRRPAIVVIPGGGYTMRAFHEAYPIAWKMIGFGYHAFILHYSVAPSRYPVAVLQLAEAIRQIRRHADEWHVDPDAIVVLGFSAGAHLAASLATGWKNDPVFAEHGYEPEQIRPNGLVVGYPVITAFPPAAEKNSFITLLGSKEKASDPVWQERLSVERHVDAGCPPVFDWHTAADGYVSPLNSLLLAQACLKAGVPVELHIFPHGDHGLGLGTKETQTGGNPATIVPDVQVWPDLFKRWMDRLFPDANFG